MTSLELRPKVIEPRKEWDLLVLDWRAVFKSSPLAGTPKGTAILGEGKTPFNASVTQAGSPVSWDLKQILQSALRSHPPHLPAHDICSSLYLLLLHGPYFILSEFHAQERRRCSRWPDPYPRCTQLSFNKAGCECNSPFPLSSMSQSVDLCSHSKACTFGCILVRVVGHFWTAHSSTCFTWLMCYITVMKLMP